MDNSQPLCRGIRSKPPCATDLLNRGFFLHRDGVSLFEDYPWRIGPGRRVRHAVPQSTKTKTSCSIWASRRVSVRSESGCAPAAAVAAVIDSST